MYIDLVSLEPGLFYITKILTLITAFVNMGFLIGMLYVYVGRYLEVKSKFINGLILFALLLLIQNVLFAIYYVFNLPQNLMGAVTPLIFLGLEFMALAILLRITWE